MSHRMACKLSGKISAIAAVSGTLNFPGNFPVFFGLTFSKVFDHVSDCQPQQPISILSIHGTLDPLFPWYGGLFQGLPKTVDSWLQWNDCNLDQMEENPIAWGIEEKKWTDCANTAAQVSLVKIQGGFHAWPPKRMKPEEFIWAFFKSSMEI